MSTKNKEARSARQPAKGQNRKPASPQKPKPAASRASEIKLVPPLKWHGGKYYLAKRILEHAPRHLHYVEPFAGGLQVLLAKDQEGVSEVVNDVHKDLTNFWSVLQNEEQFAKFAKTLSVIPFSESEFERARQDELAGQDQQLSDLKRAVNFFIVCRQSLAGRMDSFTGITKTRTRRGMNNEVSAWLSVVDALPAVHARLRRVLILNRCALDVIRGQDGRETWFYLDPPYLDETRTAADVYDHEMSREQHMELLETLAELKGKFALSGYPSKLYDDFAKKRKWRRVDFDLPNNSAAGATKRRMIESLWMN